MVKKFMKYPSNYPEESQSTIFATNDEESSWYSEMRKDLEDGNISGILAYDSPYEEYFNDIYQDVVDELSNKYINLFMEPSSQGRVGKTFVWFDTPDGEHVSGDWDFSQECDAIDQISYDCATLVEFKQSVYEYYDSKLTAVLEDFNS